MVAYCEVCPFDWLCSYTWWGNWHHREGIVNKLEPSLLLSTRKFAIPPHINFNGIEDTTPLKNFSYCSSGFWKLQASSIGWWWWWWLVLNCIAIFVCFVCNVLLFIVFAWGISDGTRQVQDTRHVSPLSEFNRPPISLNAVVGPGGLKQRWTMGCWSGSVFTVCYCFLLCNSRYRSGIDGIALGTRIKFWCICRGWSFKNVHLYAEVLSCIMLGTKDNGLGGAVGCVCVRMFGLILCLLLKFKIR